MQGLSDREVFAGAIMCVRHRRITPKQYLVFVWHCKDGETYAEIGNRFDPPMPANRVAEQVQLAKLAILAEVTGESR
jgi:hypothetical protein